MVSCGDDVENSGSPCHAQARRKNCAGSGLAASGTREPQVVLQSCSRACVLPHEHDCMIAVIA